MSGDPAYDVIQTSDIISAIKASNRYEIKDLRRSATHQTEVATMGTPKSVTVRSFSPNCVTPNAVSSKKSGIFDRGLGSAVEVFPGVPDGCDEGATEGQPIGERRKSRPQTPIEHATDILVQLLQPVENGGDLRMLYPNPSRSGIVT